MYSLYTKLTEKSTESEGSDRHQKRMVQVNFALAKFQKLRKTRRKKS